MAVIDQTPYTQAVGNNVATVYPFSFLILVKGDIKVYLDTVLKVVDVDYTVSGLGVLTGGNVTFTVAPGSGVKVSLIRDMARTRSTDYQNLGDFNADVVDADFDRAILLTQDQRTALGRTVRVPETEFPTVPILPPVASRLGKYLYFDAVNGLPEMASSLGTTALSRSVIGGFLYPQTVAEVAADVTPTDFSFPEGDVRRYGAQVDGVTDDTTAIQAAINVREAANVGGDVVFPPGTALISSGLTIKKNSILMWGAGQGGANVGNNNGTTIKSTFNGPAVTCGVSGGGRWNIGLENLRIDISGAGSSAKGIQWYAVRHPRLKDIYIATSEGSASPTGQTAMEFDGEGAFCGWGVFLNFYAQGDFTKGIYSKGNAAFNGLNSSVFIGGGVYSTRSSIHAGSYGVHIAQGTGNQFLGFDFRGFQTNLQCDADADRNTFHVRHETGSSTNYAVFAAGSSFNLYDSRSHSWDNMTDAGTDNTFILQNGFTKIQIQSNLATESILVQTTAVDGVAQASLQNDAANWSLQLLGTSADKARFRNVTTSKTAWESADGGQLTIPGSLDHDGTTVGFYDTAPIAKQTGVAVTAAAIHAALVALGLIAA